MIETMDTPVLPPLPEICEPWRDPIRCPLIIFVFLVVIGVIANLLSLFKIPDIDRNGNRIDPSRKTFAVIVAIIINLIIAYLFGLWIFNLCKQCQFVNSWLVFLLVIFLPIIVAVVINVLVSSILGVGHVLFF